MKIKRSVKMNGRQNENLITLDDINGMMCPICHEVAEVVNCEENGKVLFNYGQMQLQDKNYKEAFRLFEKSAEFGNTHSQHNLAVMLINGQGCKKNYGKAKSILEEASKNGNPDADFTLGRMYLEGKGVKRDGHKSYELTVLADERGSSLAKGFWKKMDMRREGGQNV
jgi:TPR repeat protein